MSDQALLVQLHHQADSPGTLAVVELSLQHPDVAGAEDATDGDALRRGRERLLHGAHRIAAPDALARLGHVHEEVLAAQGVLLLRAQAAPVGESEHLLQPLAHHGRVVVGDRASEQFLHRSGIHGVHPLV
jgi:hypothetical protein